MKSENKENPFEKIMKGDDNVILSELKGFVSNLWWLLVISGIASILFGIITLFMPGLTLAMLITLVTGYLMLLGLIELVYGFSTIGKDKSWMVSVLLGAALLGISVYLILHPGINAIMFVAMIGGILVARGISAIFAGTLLKSNRVLAIISGILSIVAGIIIWVYPGIGSLAFTWVLGLYALIDGTLIVSSALTMRSSYHDLANKVDSLKLHNQMA